MTDTAPQTTAHTTIEQLANGLLKNSIKINNVIFFKL